MASATLNLKINKWTRAVIAIIKEYNKLEDSYMRAFDAIIYYTENSPASSSIMHNVEKLNEYLDGCVQSDFTTALRDFCKLSETALIDNFSDFRNELKIRGFFNDLEQSYGYVPALKKEDRERIRQQIEAERREKERREAERRRREEEERQRRLEEERKRREEAEKIRKEIERGRLDEEGNPLKVIGFILELSFGLLLIGASYTLFLSPVSIIAKWTILSAWQCFFYVIGALIGVGLCILLPFWILELTDEDSTVTLSLGTLVIFWSTYGAYRLFPILNGWLSWTFFIIFILLDIICVIIILLTLESDEMVLYKHDGNPWTSKNQLTTKSLILAFIGLTITMYAALSVVTKHDYGHKTIAYHRGEYKELLAKADECIASEDYYSAIKHLEEARERKTSERKREAVSNRIAETQALLDEQARVLKSEINSLLDIFKRISFKYGRPEEDLKLTQEKLDQLKKITPEDPEIADLQKKLDYHINRTK